MADGKRDKVTTNQGQGDSDQAMAIGFPSRVSALKPQIDQIISEVQKQLPDIDFDSSDNQSDNEDFIFCHQKLKMDKANDASDTSLSLGDPAAAAEENLEFDNDLAAFRSNPPYPTEEEIKDWRILAEEMENSEAELEMREEADLKRSQDLGHSEIAAVNTDNSSIAQDASVEMESSNVDNCNSEIQDKNKAEFQEDTASDSVNNNNVPETVQKFQQRLQDGVKSMEMAKPQRKFPKGAQNKADDIMSKFMLQEPTVLSRELLDELEIDSVLNAASEDVTMIISEALSPKSNSLNGNQDEEMQEGASEASTLIQKLAELSIQSGGDVESLRSLDPHTGAAKTSPGFKAKKSLSDKENTTDESQIADADSQTSGMGTTSKGTSTASDTEKAKSSNGHLKLETRDEPPTVLDLRNFEHNMEDESRGLKTVKRVLRLPPDQSKEESSSSDDERVERCDWRLTRQKIKKDIVGVSRREDTDHAEKRSISREESTKEALVQDESVGEDMVSSYADIEKAEGAAQPTLEELMFATSQASAASERGRSLTHTPGDEVYIYDLLWRMDLRKKVLTPDEKKKKKQMENDLERLDREIQKRQDAQKRDQKRRENISSSIAACRSTGSTEGKQSAGQSTPNLFDVDVTFEEGPTVLPRNLSPDREMVLMSINLASNCRPYPFRSKPTPSTDPEDPPKSTYHALLTYFLKFVPENSNALLRPPLPNIEDAACKAFYVIGLQQLFIEGVLKLYVAVTPSETFDAHYNIFAGSDLFRRFQNKRENRSRFNQFMSRLMAFGSFEEACPWMFIPLPVVKKAAKPEDKCDEPYVYSLPLSKMSTKPMATFIEVHPDPQAAQKIFGIPLGFHWQTIDNDETSCSDDGCLEDVAANTENTMSLILSEIYTTPCMLMTILDAMAQECLDVAGIRLLYLSPPQLILDKGQSPKHAMNSVAPVLAVAVRGEHAKNIWYVASKPPETDPDDLRDTLASFFQNQNTILSKQCRALRGKNPLELIRWFGGRVPKGVATVSVGAPYMMKEEEENAKRKKEDEEKAKRGEDKKAKRGKDEKAKRKKSKQDDADLEMPVVRPPAALTATSRSDVFLIVSPLCPMSYFGLILMGIQEKGYWMRGVKRLKLTLKMAGTLGIHDKVQFFCPGVPMEECKDKSAEAIAPVTVLLLTSENAGLKVGNLMEAIMVILTQAGMLGIVQQRAKEPLTTQHLFHGVLYSDAFLTLFGGRMSKIPEMNIGQRLVLTASETIRAEEEAIAVVTLIGKDFLKRCGPFVASLLNVLPASMVPMQNDRFELLGVTCIPALTVEQAMLLSPYVREDDQWRPSVYHMESEPALMLALRGMNIIKMLTPMILGQQQLLMKNAAGLKIDLLAAPFYSERPEVTMSIDPKDSERLAHIFFNIEELYPDPHARWLLPVVHESRLYLDVTLKNYNGQKLRSFTLKDFDKLDVTKEDLTQAFMGQPPITTLLIVKSRAVEDLGIILNKLVLTDKFSIVGLRFMMFSRKNANFFIPYAHKKDKSRHKKHIEAFTCGPVVVVALQKPNAIKILYNLLGPNDPVLCRSQNASLYRGVFGSDIFNNGLYCSLNYWDAVRDLKYLFPDGLCVARNDILRSEEIHAPAIDSIFDTRPDARSITLTYSTNQDAQSQEATVQGVDDPRVETTCLLLCPRMLKLNTHTVTVPALDVIETFLDFGLKIVGCRLVCLTNDQARSLVTSTRYRGYKDTGYLSRDQLLVLAMESRNAVRGFRSLFKRTAKSRRLYDHQEDEICRPETIEDAHKMLKIFFDGLLPGSRLTITSNTQGGDLPGEESTVTAEEDGTEAPEASDDREAFDPAGGPGEGGPGESVTEAEGAECLGAEGGAEGGVAVYDPALSCDPFSYDPEKWTEL